MGSELEKDICEFIPPFPERGSGAHRILVLLVEHEDYAKLTNYILKESKKESSDVRNRYKLFILDITGYIVS